MYPLYTLRDAPIVLVRHFTKAPGPGRAYEKAER